ncbi:hypothetical protein B0H16DRAFT_1740706 [Mycena metata]|uniref:Uncharacterized protein n=1 Tax=Mycena metata TaxID=1033252 RepID=A0AAD7HC72_9AGAR|nr:hypothetical protein B0H16DRAFT_1740706 [Mycena metata]
MARLSHSSKISYGSHRPFTAARSKQNIVNVNINRTATQIARDQHIYTDQIASLGFAQWEELLGNDVHMPDASWADDGWVDDDNDDAAALQTFPPGEEGMLLSHAGQDATFQQVLAGVRPGRGDLRVRSDRVQKVVDSWKRQMPALVDAYFALKTNGAMNSDSAPSPWRIEVLGFGSTIQL